MIQAPSYSPSSSVKAVTRSTASNEPYVMVFKGTSPFEMHGISSKSIWIHGRGRAGETSKPEGQAFEGLDEWNQTKMFCVTSISRKVEGRGYINDVVFLRFGIEDERTAWIDVVAGDLLKSLALRSTLLRCGIQPSEIKSRNQMCMLLGQLLLAIWAAPASGDQIICFSSPSYSPHLEARRSGQKLHTRHVDMTQSYEQVRFV